MNFAEAMNNETRRTQTTNGALAINSTGDALVDLFGSIGALRNASENRIETLFTEAYNENPLSAMKILFYADPHWSTTSSIVQSRGKKYSTRLENLIDL